MIWSFWGTHFGTSASTNPFVRAAQLILNLVALRLCRQFAESRRSPVDARAVEQATEQLDNSDFLAAYYFFADDIFVNGGTIG